MHLHLTPIARSSARRLIAICADSCLRLVWDGTSFCIPLYDLQHLAAALDDWHALEEPPGLRRGYYRLSHGPDGGIQLWLNNAGLLLSRDDLRGLTELVRDAEEHLQSVPAAPASSPFGPGYQLLVAPPCAGCAQN